MRLLWAPPVSDSHEPLLLFLLSDSELIFMQERQCTLNRHNCTGDVIVLRGNAEVYGVAHICIMELALFKLGVGKIAAAK